MPFIFNRGLLLKQGLSRPEVVGGGGGVPTPAPPPPPSPPPPPPPAVTSHPDAVYFGNTPPTINDYLYKSGVSGSFADSTQIAFYAKFITTQEDGSTLTMQSATYDGYFMASSSTGIRFDMESGTTGAGHDATKQGYLHVRLEDGSGARVLETESDLRYNDGTVYEWFFAADASAGTYQSYIALEDAVPASIAHTDIFAMPGSQTIDLTRNTYSVAANNSSGVAPFDGGLYRVALWGGVYPDLTDSAKTDDMRDTTATLGGTKYIEIRGPASDVNAGTNYGTIGTFTVNGTVVDFT